MLVIVGPTAAGKSDLAVELALLLGAGSPGAAEVLSADSMQVFRGMDVGTGKLPEPERRGVPHHLLDIRDPAEPFSVDAWLELAERAVADVRARGRTPIVVGGSLLYAKALLEGLFEGPAPDEAARAALRAMDPAERRRELERVDPDAAARIHPNDERRTVRALEVFRATGRPISALQGQWDRGGARPDAALLGLEWSTAGINRRINARVARMMDEGLLPEAWALWSAGRLGPQAREALGYKQLAAAFAGNRWTAEPPADHPAILEAVEQMKIETRRFAKNQRTWLRRLRTSGVSPQAWIDADATDPRAWASVAAGLLATPGAESPGTSENHARPEPRTT